MPQLEFFVVCEGVSLDARTGRLSLFDVLEEVGSTGLPAVLPRLVAVSTWNLELTEMGNEHQVGLIVHGPGGSEHFKKFVNFTAKSIRHRVIQEINHASFDVAGPWRLELTLDGKPEAHHLVHVHQVEGEG
jgi:hypothetical protein